MLTNVAPLMLLLAVIVAGLALWQREKVPAAIAAAAGLWFAFLLVPYVFASADARPDDADEVHRALQYNVYFGNDDLDRIAGLVEGSGADVVALHEITTEQWIGLQPLLPSYPYALAEPWDGDGLQLGGGMALLSRAPLTAIEVDPEASVLGRPILAASTEVGGADIVIVGLHPHASRFEGAKVDLRNRQLDAVGELLRDESRPALILTDLNMAPTSSDYRSLLDDLGWRDPHRVTGWDASWPTWGGFFGLPIDHILVSNDVALHSLESGDGGGSDHRSLVAEFSLGHS